FRYGPYLFTADGRHKVAVRMHYDEATDTYTFHRIKRSLQWEDNRLKELLGMGLEKSDALFSNLGVQRGDEQTGTVLDWLRDKHDDLLKMGYEIVQEDPDKRFFFGNTVLDLTVSEENDWFDVKAIARFGTYEIPFS